MAHNAVGDDGASALAAALSSTPSLHILRLNANDNLGDGAADAFAKAVLDVKCPLDELWLSSIHIGGEAAERLRRAWEKSGRDETLLVI
eukprot:scaffold8498_cov28-Tisochrysis_lutea.AAC.2